MSEEEKKSIEILKERKRDLLGLSNSSFYSSDRKLYKERVEAIDTILNLIEKQQKEIEELGNRKAENYYHWQHLEAKIINKIEEITSYAYTSAEERDCQDYAIQVLKELLGE